MKIEMKSIEDLSAAVKKIIAALEHPVIFFHGEMGSGKTTFIKEMVHQLGSLDVVNSPTFSLVNEYDIPGGEVVYHFDLYRLKDIEEALDMGIEEYLYSNSLCLIEWPDKIAKFAPDEHHRLSISVEEHEGSAVRIISFDE